MFEIKHVTAALNGAWTTKTDKIRKQIRSSTIILCNVGRGFLLMIHDDTIFFIAFPA